MLPFPSPQLYCRVRACVCGGGGRASDSVLDLSRNQLSGTLEALTTLRLLTYALMLAMSLHLLLLMLLLMLLPMLLLMLLLMLLVNCW